MGDVSASQMRACLTASSSILVLLVYRVPAPDCSCMIWPLRMTAKPDPALTESGVNDPSVAMIKHLSDPKSKNTSRHDASAAPAGQSLHSLLNLMTTSGFMSVSSVQGGQKQQFHSTFVEYNVKIRMCRVWYDSKSLRKIGIFYFETPLYPWDNSVLSKGCGREPMAGMTAKFKIIDFEVLFLQLYETEFQLSP